MMNTKGRKKLKKIYMSEQLKKKQKMLDRLYLALKIAAIISFGCAVFFFCTVVFAKVPSTLKELGQSRVYMLHQYGKMAVAILAGLILHAAAEKI